MAENRHRGSTLDSFLEKEGVLVTSKAKAIEEVTEWQLIKEREVPGSQSGLAKS